MPGSPSPAPRPWRIGWIAASVLVLELSFIRQIPAEVHAISYFTNLILMAAFFGLGLGCILQQKRSLDWLLPAGLGLIFAFIYSARGIVIYPETRDIHYWLDPETVEGGALRLPLVLAAATVFVITATPFVALGQRLARTMDRHPRLVAYGWDIAGSLAGTVLFALSSVLELPPWIWPPVLMALWAAFFQRSIVPRAACLGAGLVFLAFVHSPQEFRWSPYYYVQFERQEEGIRVWVNSSFHQIGIDWSSENPRHREVNATLFRRWSRPYETFRELNGGRSAEKVLVLGAGTGNDVNVALANGALEIVAVEIDPVILELGEKYNATRPYDSPRVRVEVDDARNFLRNSEERFDIVVFGTIDSQSLLSGHSNLRLENYVYTREALADARRLIADGGVVAIFYSVYKPWLYGRIYSTVREVFGDQSRIHLESSHVLFNTTIVATRGRQEFRDAAANVARFGGERASTDDWPFIYLERPTVAPVYWQLIAVVAVLIAGVVVLLRRIHPVTGLHANFLFLGVGFTLVESSSIVRLNLLFGSTWTVNAVVFAAVLSTIFAANWMVLVGRAPPSRWAWIGLFGALLINYAFPLDAFFALGFPSRVAASGLLVGIPVFFAAVCFSHLFRRQRITGYALGLNLVGAMAGGLVEYASMVVGMRMIWLIILGVYLLAWLASALVGERSAA